MQTTKRAVWGVILAVVLTMVVPVLSFGGSLDPSAAPAATMKTLDQIPPIWSQTLSCNSAQDCPRFQIVLDGNAVLDKETGLVWDKTPTNFGQSWFSAIWNCQNKEIAGRKGWRLATIEELMSLADFSSGALHANGSMIPDGNPFTGLPSSGTYYHWSASTDAADTTHGIAVDLRFGNVVTSPKASNNFSWCVRGGKDHAQ
jgi:hypothetical protein